MFRYGRTDGEAGAGEAQQNGEKEAEAKQGNYRIGLSACGDLRFLLKGVFRIRR